MAWLRAMLPRCQLRLDDLDFQMLSEQEGELRAAVTMEAVVLRDETAEIVKDITPGGGNNSLPHGRCGDLYGTAGGYALENCQALPHNGGGYPCGQ